MTISLPSLKYINNNNNIVSNVSADDKEGQFLFQRLSIALQRFNAA